jgi:hypothetical protein
MESGDRGPARMSRPLIVALYIAAMVAVIVGLDLAFFRGHVWARLMVNIGVVLVFGAFYVRFFGRAGSLWR